MLPDPIQLSAAIGVYGSEAALAALAGYYGAFVLDAHGDNIEAVFRDVTA